YVYMLERRYADPQRNRHCDPDAYAGDGAPEEVREEKHERENRQNRDVPARHVRRQPHRQRKGPHEHAEHFDRDEQHVDERGEPLRHEIHPVLKESMGLRAGDDDGAEGNRRKGGRHVEVGLAVVPPWSRCLTKESSPVWSTQRSRRPRTSKIGIRPMAFAQRMKTKKVRMSGVHVFTHLRPTLGSTMVSRTNSTTHSIPFIRPDG